ncbi:unnamed protein product [Phaedon cochleariae]|uniref:PHD-type domain-containing protein n=1 Tax=Phaedon cochleariae TaxID=80249 RepID=A0A9N9SNF8_PHACE|nr:unnamed protein product [Phaedon cochleariae]
MQSICKYCVQHITKKSPGLQCSGFCQLHYHFKCVNLTVDQHRLLKSVPGSSWKCPACAVADANNSLRTAATGAETATNISSAVDVLEAEDGESNIQGSTKIFISMRDELRAMRRSQEELINSVSFCSAKISDFEKSLVEIRSTMKELEKMKEENNVLKKQVSDLNLKVNDIEQTSRLNNTEIQGIPENRNENLKTVVGEISRFLGVDILDKIETVHRVQSNKNNENRPRNIIVRFNSRELRDQLLASAKAKRQNSDNTIRRSIRRRVNLQRPIIINSYG